MRETSPAAIKQREREEVQAIFGKLRESPRKWVCIDNWQRVWDGGNGAMIAEALSTLNSEYHFKYEVNPFIAPTNVDPRESLFGIYLPIVKRKPMIKSVPIQ